MSYFDADERLEKGREQTAATPAPGGRAARQWTASSLFAADEALERSTAGEAGPGPLTEASAVPSPPHPLAPTPLVREEGPGTEVLTDLAAIDAALAGNTALLATNGVFVQLTTAHTRQKRRKDRNG
jgi:hypothetical protein